MTVRIKAHFDGKTIVPDEPVDLPVGTAVTVEVSAMDTLRPVPIARERLAALGQFGIDGNLRLEHLE